MSDLINEFEEITRWPKKRLDKEYIIKYLSEKFQPGTEYSEKEVNSIIKKHHTFNDVPLLRRELISKKYLSRIDDYYILEKLAPLSWGFFVCGMIYLRQMTNFSSFKL